MLSLCKHSAVVEELRSDLTTEITELRTAVQSTNLSSPATNQVQTSSGALPAQKDRLWTEAVSRGNRITGNRRMTNKNDQGGRRRRPQKTLHPGNKPLQKDAERGEGNRSLDSARARVKVGYVNSLDWSDGMERRAGLEWSTGATGWSTGVGVPTFIYIAPGRNSSTVCQGLGTIYL